MPSPRISIDDIEMNAQADTSGQLLVSTEASKETRRVSLSGSAGEGFESPSLKNGASPDELPDPEPWERLHVTRIHEKLAGYPRMAAFQASDSNFAMARNFSYLRSRVILQKQQKLRSLEEKLDEMDAEDATHTTFLLQSREYEISTRGKLKDNLIDQIDQELKAYDELLLRERAMRTLQQPSKRNYNSVLSFLNSARPLVDTEEQVLLHPNEIVSLGGAGENTWLEGKIEQYLKKALPLRWLQKIFTEPEMRVRPGEELPHYFSKSRISVLVAMVVQAVAIILVLGSTALLLTVGTTAQKLAITLVALICFCGATATCASLRYEHIFMLTSAFAAVLVVFLQSSSDVQCIPSTPAQAKPPKMYFGRL